MAKIQIEVPADLLQNQEALRKFANRLCEQGAFILTMLRGGDASVQLENVLPPTTAGAIFRLKEDSSSH